MKPNRFIQLFLLLLVGAAGIYLWACRQDAEPALELTPSNMAVTDRACPTGFCSFFVTPDDDADFTFCGNLDNPTGACGFGCSLGDGYIATSISANNTYEVCVAEDGSVCIQNAAAAPAIDITVQFDASTPIDTTIPGGGKLCFYTDGDCTITRPGCHP